MTYYTCMDSPIGALMLVSDGTALTTVYMADPARGLSPQCGWQQSEDARPLEEARRQLEEYFAGCRTTFDVPLKPRGTEFQRRVWQELCRIPYGVTISYGELARRIGNPNASRAVGLANGQNPLAIVVPCHRVIGANGKLVGYGGGLPRKQMLLELERREGRPC